MIIKTKVFPLLLALLLVTVVASAQNTTDGCMAGQACGGRTSTGTQATQHTRNSANAGVGQALLQASALQDQKSMDARQATLNQDDSDEQPFANLNKQAADLQAQQQKALEQQALERQRMLQQTQQQWENTQQQNNARFNQLKNASQTPDPSPHDGGTPNVAKDPNVDYSGEACSYFTKQADAAHIPRYADGSWVAYGTRMYVCEGGHWASKGPKTTYKDYENSEAAVLEH